MQPQPLYLEGFSPQTGEDGAGEDVWTGYDPFNSTLTELQDAPTPEISFYIHDHLGNLRVLYHTTFKGCAANDVVYHLEQVADYYPYGKSLREYVADTEEKFLTTHHERDVETGLDYRGARFYDGEVGRFLSVDPLAADYAEISPYMYVAGNPILFIDPDGRNHIFYLVFQKGNTETDAIAKHTQSILDENGINLQVQVMYIGNEGLKDGYQNLLDPTDALTFVGDESFVESLYGRSIGIGITDGRVGYVDAGAVGKDLEGRKKIAGDENKFVARAALHEGVGHVFAGIGHTDSDLTPERYREGDYMFDEDGNFIPNVMTSGTNTVYSNDRTFNFVTPDLNLIKAKIPDYSINLNRNGCKIEICFINNYPKDNFTKRLNE